MIVLLLCPLILSNEVVRDSKAADTTAPIIHGVYLNATVATPGDLVKILVNATDDDSGIQYVSVSFCNPDGNDLLIGSLSYNIITTFYEVLVEINPHWLNGDYYIQSVSASDVAGNYVQEDHPDDFTSPILTVSGTTPDTNPPELHSLVFDRENATSYKTVLILANITDDASGIQNAEARIMNPAMEPLFYITLHLNSTSGLFEGSFEVNPYWMIGNYFIEHFMCGDTADNWMNGFYNVLFPVKYLKVYGTLNDRKPPNLNSIYFDCLYVHFGGTVRAFANVSDDISGVSSVNAFFQDPAYSISVSHSMYYDPGLKLYFRDYYIGSHMMEGRYFFEEINLSDNAGNKVFLSLWNHDYVSPLVAVIDPSSDLDMDEMWDDWERQNSLNSSDSSDAAQDNDNDGLINNEEFLYESNPWNKDSDGDARYETWLNLPEAF